MIKIELDQFTITTLTLDDAIGFLLQYRQGNFWGRVDPFPEDVKKKKPIVPHYDAEAAKKFDDDLSAETKKRAHEFGLGISADDKPKRTRTRKPRTVRPLTKDEQRHRDICTVVAFLETVARKHKNKNAQRDRMRQVLGLTSNMGWGPRILWVNRQLQSADMNPKDVYTTITTSDGSRGYERGLGYLKAYQHFAAAKQNSGA